VRRGQAVTAGLCFSLPGKEGLEMVAFFLPFSPGRTESARRNARIIIILDLLGNMFFRLPSPGVLFLFPGMDSLPVSPPAEFAAAREIIFHFHSDLIGRFFCLIHFMFVLFPFSGEESTYVTPYGVKVLLPETSTPPFSRF